MEKELTTLPPEARAAVALSSSQTEIDLRALAIKNVNITQVIDKPGREQAHGAAMEIKRARVAIEKTGKDARDDATKFSKAVIAEEKRLIAIIEAEETRLLGLRDAWDQEQERIKREEEARERVRVTAIHEDIANIRNFGTLALQCRTAERIAGLMGKLANKRDEGYSVFQEFAVEAEQVLVSTMQTLTKLHADKLKEEIETARVKAEQEAAAAQLAVERAALEKEKAEVEAAKAAIAKTISESQAAIDASRMKNNASGQPPQLQPPVDEYEQELQAFQAAVQTPAPAPAILVIDGPLVMSSALRAQFEKTYPVEVWNPSDMQILDALCQHFNKSERLVYERLARGFDLAALNAATFEDVPL